MTPSRHPSAAFWITVALVAVLVTYPLSFGPACWLTASSDRFAKPDRAMIIYWPLGGAAAQGPEPVYKTLRWWMCLGVSGHRHVRVPTNSSGSEWFGDLNRQPPGPGSRLRHDE